MFSFSASIATTDSRKQFSDDVQAELGNPIIATSASAEGRVGGDGRGHGGSDTGTGVASAGGPGGGRYDSSHVRIPDSGRSDCLMSAPGAIDSPSPEAEKDASHAWANAVPTGELKVRVH